MITILHGDCREVLQTMPERSVQCVVTSPPYYGLRRYSDDPREIGQEAQPDCVAWARRDPPCDSCYVCAMRAVFAGLWRVLRDDGVVFLNLGDSYGRGDRVKWSGDAQRGTNAHKVVTESGGYGTTAAILPDKNLLGVPWRVALALQSDGWYLRSDIVWSKPNCMPESVTDRPTRAHEYVFLLAKNARYFYDADAIREPHTRLWGANNGGSMANIDHEKAENREIGQGHNHRGAYPIPNPAGRNRRTVWSIATQPYSGAHYATMPEALIEPCVLAGSSAQACEHCGAPWVRKIEKKANSTPVEERTGRQSHNGTPPQQSGWFWQPPEVTDLGFIPSCTCPDNIGSAASVVLDPFAGSGTVLRVAARYQRDAIGIELNETYISDHVNERTNGVQLDMTGLF